MSIGVVNSVVVALVSVVIIVCSIAIIVASKFQQKQRKKYNECLDIINENKDGTFTFKDSLTKEEINKIDSSIDVDSLMSNLYDTYITLENKLKAFDTDLDGVLTGYIKDFYVNKIENFKERGFTDVTDGIDLIGYSITEFKKDKLKFRITMNCFCYKTINGKIVSGSNLEKIEQILLITYQKVNDKWLISAYEKIYEKKLSD